MAIGRNDPCPCGSGKKYKKCHLGKPLNLPTAYFSATGVPATEPLVVAPAPVPGEEWLTEPLELGEGKTPLWIKRLVEDAIKHVFDKELNDRRGELRLYVSESVTRLLKRLGIRARVVAGSALWAEYPVGFIWKGSAEFHAWVQTQFGEVVDLACDALHQRRNQPFLLPPGPPVCWDKPHLLKDRTYTEAPGGAIQVGVYAGNEPHLASVPKLLEDFVKLNEADYSQRFGQS